MSIPAEYLGYIINVGSIALMGWLLKRAINSLDDSIRDIRADLHALDQTDRQQGKDILEQSIRLRLAESGLARLVDRFEEFGKFMSRMGFKRSNDVKPKPPSDEGDT